MELRGTLAPGEAQLFEGDDNLDVGPLAMVGGVVALHCSKSPQRETANEDAAAIFAATEDSGFVAVADGVGGARAGKLASALALRCLLEAARDAHASGQALRDGILNGFESANEAIRSAAAGAATTMNVVEVDSGTVRSFHAGDSLTLVVGQRSKVKMQIIPHSPVGYGVESGLLDESEALHSDERHVVSNVVGSSDMRIDVGPRVALAPRDTLLLASDGLSDNLEAAEIVEHIRAGDLRVGLGRLSQLARSRMLVDQEGKPSKPDDLTVLAFRPLRRRS